MEVMENNEPSGPAEPRCRPLRIGDAAPLFRARSTRGDVVLEAYRGRWLLFFSHPADFTPVCTSEFVALAKAQPLFEAIACDLLGLSVDSLYAHFAWVKAIRDLFEVDVRFPILEDPSMAVAQAYGMLDEAARDSAAVRASFVIDPIGVIRAITWYPATVGRSVEELLRLVQALQRVADDVSMTPEGWVPGSDVLDAPLTALGKDGILATDWFCRIRSDD